MLMITLTLISRGSSENRIREKGAKVVACVSTSKKFDHSPMAVADLELAEEGFHFQGAR